MPKKLLPWRSNLEVPQPLSNAACARTSDAGTTSTRRSSSFTSPLSTSYASKSFTGTLSGVDIIFARSSRMRSFSRAICGNIMRKNVAFFSSISRMRSRLTSRVSMKRRDSLARCNFIKGVNEAAMDFRRQKRRQCCDLLLIVGLACIAGNIKRIGNSCGAENGEDRECPGVRLCFRVCAHDPM